MYTRWIMRHTFEETIAQLGSGARVLGPKVGPESSRDMAIALFRSSDSSSPVISIVGTSGFSGLEASHISCQYQSYTQGSLIYLRGGLRVCGCA